MEQYKKDFIDFMVECKALKFGDFTLKSGRKSPFFMNAGAYVTGGQLLSLGRFYAQAIHQNFGDDFDVLFGPAYKGIPLAVAAAIAYSELYGRQVRYCSNRKEIKDHGDKGILLGAPLRDGDRVVIIEDVTTSGASIAETYPIIMAQADVRIKGLIVSLDRMERGGGEGAGGKEGVAEIADKATETASMAEKAAANVGTAGAEATGAGATGTTGVAAAGNASAAGKAGADAAENASAGATENAGAAAATAGGAGATAENADKATETASMTEKATANVGTAGAEATGAGAGGAGAGTTAGADAAGSADATGNAGAGSAQNAPNALSALQEIQAVYGFPAAAIVTMRDVIQYLYMPDNERGGNSNAACSGNGSTEIRAALHEYYAKWGSAEAQNLL